jgi:hypothetical protein
LAASRDSPPDAVGKLASRLIDRCVELRCISHNLRAEVDRREGRDRGEGRVDDVDGWIG